LEKIEPRLKVEIDRTKLQGFEGQRPKFKVIMEHKERIRLSNTAERNRRKNIEELQKQVLQKQTPIISKLTEIGAEQNFKVLPFANSVYAELTYDQIMEMSKLQDIKVIRLSREDKVIVS
jgi:hypothetical protein